MSVRQQLVARAYLGGWKLVRRMPPRLADACFNLAADCWSRRGRGLPQLRKNLARVTEVNDALIRKAARSYARYWREAFQLPALASDPALHAKLESSARGLERLEASLDKGKGVVLVTTHSGNWDMAGVLLVHLKGTFSTVAERLKPEVLYEAFVDYREGLGFKVLPLTGADKPFGRLKATLNEGGIVCLLGERDLTRSGVEVQFFGETTRMPAGPAKLAIETGAALHPVHLSFTSDGWGIEVGEAISVSDLRTTVQHVADALAEGIARHPADWHMLQPLWLSDLDMQRYLEGLKE
ncbi:phosphatidylinositol mannoside acyltransferase [Corynebacterium gerontici]|uniref:Phosphatidylinositol mannoside acyltransferase n=1 Tax=Corynebacterium gerontici TaxID=2079234 RepID=A0A3G6J0W8_9CORY|nr:phosphatidylinositol mannoside acyltransferase [Corynebacterium gerontici]AZA11556.1 Phosphatidylinositol mannoside acyltransferase [Corynebacterium gerontici]